MSWRTSDDSPTASRLNVSNEPMDGPSYRACKPALKEAAMPDVRKTTRYILVAGAGLAILFVLAQVAQLAELAGAIHPWFGVAVAVALLLAIGWLVAVPALTYMRLRPALVPPPQGEPSRSEAFVEAYLEECRYNPLLSDRSLDSEEDLEAALEVLTVDAERIANRYASQVFVGTAVSQWGSLDALVVAGVQARMVWEIAHVYQRRPPLRQIGYLYANVGATSLLASRLDQVDLSEFLRPVLAGAFGQSIASVPGVTAVSAQVSNAMFQGSVNAFLTLRIAMVAIAYSKALHQPERRSVWQSAVARAGHLVLRTVTQGSTKVVGAFSVAAVKTVGSAASGVGSAAAAGSRAVGRSVTAAGKDAGRAVSLSAVKHRRSAAGAAATAGERVSTLGRSSVEGFGETVRGIPDHVRTARKRLWWARRADGSSDPEGDGGVSESDDDAILG